MRFPSSVSLLRFSLLSIPSLSLYASSTLAFQPVAPFSPAHSTLSSGPVSFVRASAQGRLRTGTLLRPQGFAQSPPTVSFETPNPSLRLRSASSALSTLMVVASISSSAADDKCNANPLLEDWAQTQEYGLPPFARIKPEHFRPAFDATMKSHLEDLAAIVADTDAPSFDNVCGAFDRAGSEFEKVGAVFSNLCSSLNTEELQKVQVEMAPLLAAHSSKIYTFPGLFEKLDAVAEKMKSGELAMSAEEKRLTERLHLDFVREGARFSTADKERYAAITQRLATLCTEFQQNVMADEDSFTILLKKEDMKGCPDTLMAAAKEAAREKGKAGEDDYVITLSRSLAEPFLKFADKRDKREEVWRAWTRRGELSPERDNAKIAEEMLRLRKEQADMHGYSTYSHYSTADSMAKTPEAVTELLLNVWERAKISANKEREALLAYVKKTEGENSPSEIEPWDWRYYAEKVRQAEFDLDEEELKPYLSLDAVTNAVFDVSSKLFGLQYHHRADLEGYHPDVKVYEVRETTEDGKERVVSLFLHDNFARQYKASGAWMSEFRTQTRNLLSKGGVEGMPIIANNNNCARGSPTLLSFDDATTLFHEMGHAHHGMLSDVSFRRLAGTSVLTDFVELPSQLMEHWLEQPEVLAGLKHHVTGEPIPDALMAKLKAAINFGQGFATVEYTACALLDQALHMQPNYDGFNLGDFERKELARLEMPQGIVLRHRPTHFQHLFASSGYAAAYYVYLWAEVLDADAFDAFKEAGNVFDQEVARKARKFIYSAGNSQAPDELFRQFRGRDPVIEPMLRKKGLM